MEFNGWRGWSISDVHLSHENGYQFVSSLSPFQHHFSSFRYRPWPFTPGTCVKILQISVESVILDTHFWPISRSYSSQLNTLLYNFIYGTETRRDESEKQNKEQFEWRWLHLWAKACTHLRSSHLKNTQQIEMSDAHCNTHALGLRTHTTKIPVTHKAETK